MGKLDLMAKDDVYVSYTLNSESYYD